MLLAVNRHAVTTPLPITSSESKPPARSERSISKLNASLSRAAFELVIEHLKEITHGPQLFAHDWRCHQRYARRWL